MEKLMAPDERDRSFDKALARHLRNTAPAPDSASAPGIPVSLSGACPDPETLAAYHERSLFPEQLNALKEHIVGCAHCQTILAHLETTDEISLHATEPQVAAEVAQPAPSRKSRRAVLLRGARWQWLAPAGALAAGLLVWIALHEGRSLAPPSLKNVQVAAKQEPPASGAPVSSVTREVSPAAKAAPAPLPSMDDKVAGAGGRAIAESRSGAPQSNEKLDAFAKVVPARPQADKEGRLRKDTEGDTLVELRRAEAELDRDAKAGAAGKQENSELQAQSQTLIVQSQNQTNSNLPATSGPAPLGQMEQKKRKAASAPPPAAPQVPSAVGGVASSYDSSTSALEVTRAISNPRLISAPGSTIIWRAGRGGLIELSRDGGSSWSRQASGARADLLTGSAPSAQVCWIVGRGGAILLTTDGGAHWNAINSPLAEDLGGVRAFDALHATIWNARSTKSFQTNDGGLTWTAVPSP
jgi:hypothetical protein